MSDTPRTDAHCRALGADGLVSGAFARALERENAELAEALGDLLDAVESLNGYELTRDVDHYKAEAVWQDARRRASDALSKRKKGAT